jgi:hypothetical protein
MAQPMADGGQIDPGFEQMNRRAMALMPFPALAP